MCGLKDLSKNKEGIWSRQNTSKNSRYLSKIKSGFPFPTLFDQIRSFPHVTEPETMKLKVTSFTGKLAEPYLGELARLRIQVFREYPYLYDGTLDYEKKYLQTFIQAKESIMVLAWDQERVVGVSTGIPMAQEPDEIQKPWVEAGHDIEKIFYLSESVLLKPYRGQGIGVKFFEERESWARQLGYRTAAFCSVIRPLDHPARPENYVELDGFWEKRGYRKKEGYLCRMRWKEWEEETESAKELQFWWKGLE